MFAIKVADDHFLDIIQLLTTGRALDEYMVQQNKIFLAHVADFTIMARKLYKMGTNEVLHIYFFECERCTIMDEAHGGIVGGHYADKEMTQKFFRDGF